MAGLRALFNGAQMRNIFKQFQERIDNETLLKLQYLGEEFVNKARLNGDYQDRTGNLRSSIGYVIYLDGNVVDSNFTGTKEGKDQGQKIADEVVQQYSNGYALIGVAGMNYAAYVEAKSYDVITGSAPEENHIKSILNEI